MTAYVYGRWLLADGWEEAQRMIQAAGVADHQLRMAGTARWCYEVTPGQYEWAVTSGAREVDLATVQRLVSGRVPTEMIGRGPTPTRDAAGRRRTWSANSRHHWWEQREPHVRICWWCGLTTTSRKVERAMLAGSVCTLGAWFTEWTWAVPRAGQADGSDLAGAPLPRCPGPKTSNNVHCAP